MEHISEFKKENYVDFYSAIDIVRMIKSTQIGWSWGPHAWRIMNRKQLRFKVDARRHKGHVYIAVNSFDLFDIFLTTLKGRVVKEIKNIYIDNLIRVIDNEIERIPEYKD